MTREAELTDAIRRAREELNAIEASRDYEAGKRLVGKFYVYRNCYSCPNWEEDYWNLYLFVGQADSTGYVRVLEFQTDKDGKTVIDHEMMMPRMFADPKYRQITRDEFSAAWNEMYEALGEKWRG